MDRATSSAFRLSRRGFAFGAGALSLAAITGAARGALGVTPDVLLVLDERVAGAVQLGAAAVRDGVAVAWISGDVTALWRSRLRAFWQARRSLLVGITQLDAQFCLTMLARDCGHRLVHDEPLPPGLVPAMPRRLSPRSLELSALPHAASAEPRHWIIAHGSLAA